jgi:MoaA/NifB/PqqE/SkfB family radical SAM enzyme
MYKSFLASNQQNFKKIVFWYLRRLMGRITPLISILYVTNKCNFKCSFCYVWKDGNKISMPFSNFKKIVDELSPYLLNFVISGGEPFIINNFYRYINYAAGKFQHLTVISNAFLISPMIIRKIKNVDNLELAFSLDAIGEKHDQQRHFKEAYRKVVETIKSLKKNKPKVKITIVSIVFPDKIEECYKLIQLSETLKTNIIFQALNRPIDSNPLTTNKIKPFFRNYKEKEIFKLIEFASFASKKENVLNSKYYLFSMPFYFLGKKVGLQLKNKCSLPFFLLEFNNRGEAFPCLFGSSWTGGLKWQKKESIINLINSPKFKMNIEKLSKYCQFCHKNFYIVNIEPRVAFPFSNLVRHQLATYWLKKKLKL